MNTEKLKELGAAWKELDNTYDNAFTELIDTQEQTPIAAEKLEAMRKMQDELFDLEIELYRILEGK